MPWPLTALSDFHQELMAAEHAAMAIAVKVHVAADLCDGEVNDILELFIDGCDDLFDFPVVVRVEVVGDADQDRGQDAVDLFHFEMAAGNPGCKRHVQSPAGVR